MVLQGVPEFWLALILTLVFTQTWALLPSLGYEGPLSLVLPAVALGLPVTPIVARLLRSEMLDVTKQDFVVALRAQNLSSTWIVRRHLLRNAAPVFVTFVALQLGYLVGGTLLVEMVFTWPGIGSTLLDAVQARDLVVIQAIVITVAASFVIVNLLADLFVLWRDPRVRVRAA